MHETTTTGTATMAPDGAGKHGPMAIISDAESIDLPLQTRADVRLQPETIDAAQAAGFRGCQALLPCQLIHRAPVSVTP
jgi:hypothetical protein